MGAAMTVHFIGAGPGAADLITVRGRDLVARCPVCLYAGSLVPRGSSGALPDGRAHRRHRAAVARRDHSRDRRGARAPAATSRGSIPATCRCGARSANRRAACASSASPTRSRRACPSFAAAAAALGRGADAARGRAIGRADPHLRPCVDDAPTRDARAFGATGRRSRCTVDPRAGQRRRALTPHYGADCPVAIVFARSWPDERMLRGTLADIEAKVAAEPMERTALILVGPALGRGRFPRERALRPLTIDRRFRRREAPRDEGSR